MTRRADREPLATRDRLVAAATELFAAQGYEATTIGQIEAAVGLVPRRGTLYKHFGSKEDLLRAAVDDRAVRAAAFLERAETMATHDLSTLSTSHLHDLVRQFGRDVLAEVDRHRALTRIVEHSGERFPEMRDRIRREVIAPCHREVTRALARLAPPGTDAGAHGALLLASLTGLRRTAWTFGTRAYPVSDARALDAWAAQCVAVLRPPARAHAHADAGSDAHALGYRRVDADPHAAVLLDAMDATGAWPATIELRAWERVRLRVRPGERLLDVGCGLGDAGLALAADVGAEGELVGLDASETMVRAAQARSVATPWARFVRGDASDIDLPDRSFDVARAERTLQWVDDPERVVAELVRVLHPGGRLSLIDSDWSTFRLDIGDPEVERRARDALRRERRRPSNVGARLADLARASGCEVIAAHTTVHHGTDWDPDATPAPPGFFSMRSLAGDLVDAGQLAPDLVGDFVEEVHAAARAGRFVLSLTMHAVIATTPSS